MLRLTILFAILVVVKTAPRVNENLETASVRRPPNEGYVKCETRYGTPGVCVPYYLCNLDVVKTDGAGVADIRLNNDECPTFIDKCCNLPDETSSII